MTPRIAFLCVSLLAGLAHAAPLEVLDISPVWSGHPVGFSLLTAGHTQYVGYYDDQRRLTIASRDTSSSAWTKQILPTSVGWDSHNYITMTLDDDGNLHVAANMHAVPLIYFRTTRPGDITSLKRFEHMVGPNEAKCTYPQFFRGPNKQLLFAYRDGSSGNGNQIYNAYDPSTQSWRRLLDRPLTDGQGHRNAYLTNPQLGPDGFWHLVWVWRESPDCSTNHTLSYARSKDLVHWTKADGTPLPLPLTLTNADIIDPVPQHGGIINGNNVLGFDSHNRPIISYHKFDAAGNTQAFNARFESDNHWHLYQTSNWSYRWDPSGNGTIPFEIGIGGVRARNGLLTESFRHPKAGAGLWTLDESTLKPLSTSKTPPSAPLDPPAPSDPTQSPSPNLSPRTAGDSGRPAEKGVHYLLQWETLPSNRDKPHPGPIPPPSMLRLYKLKN